MRREQFSDDTFAHVYNRGVDKRVIFMQERDYERFLLALLLFNDKNAHDYDLKRFTLQKLPPSIHNKIPLVDIVHWCLMPNHFHLVLRQLIPNGISIFMHRLSTGYTMYFNTKYERSGSLFQGTFKAKLVEKDEYFSHVCTYVPLNVVDLFKSGWKEKGVPSAQLAHIKNKLMQYRWSSYREYFGIKIRSISSQETFFEVFGGSRTDYQELIDAYLQKGLPSYYKDRLCIYEA